MGRLKQKAMSFYAGARPSFFLDPLAFNAMFRGALIWWVFLTVLAIIFFAVADSMMKKKKEKKSMDAVADMFLIFAILLYLGTCYPVLRNAIHIFRSKPTVYDFDVACCLLICWFFALGIFLVSIGKKYFEVPRSGEKKWYHNKELSNVCIGFGSFYIVASFFAGLVLLLVNVFPTFRAGLNLYVYKMMITKNAQQVRQRGVQMMGPT